MKEQIAKELLKVAKSLVAYGGDYYVEIEHYGMLGMGDTDDYLDIAKRYARDAEVSDVDDHGQRGATITISSDDEEGLIDFVDDWARKYDMSVVWTK